MLKRLYAFLATFRLPAFESIEQERVFWIKRDQRRLEFRKFFLLCGLLTAAAMGSLDVIIGGEATDLLLGIRAVAILIMSYLFYRFCQARTPLRREWVIVTFGAVFVFANFAMTLVGPSDVAKFYPFILSICLIFGSCLLVPKFHAQAIFCVITNLAYWPIAFLIEIPKGDFYMGAFVMAISSLSVAVGSMMREQLEREQALSESRIVAARDQAVRAAQAKSYLLANVSHELRTPLNAIIGFSEIMEQETFGQIEQPQYREYIRDIHYSGKLLHTNINDLLDLSRLEVDKMNWVDEDFSLSDVLKKVIATCTPSAETVNITLSKMLKANTVTMHGDADRMSQALINVITNAVKFSDPGTTVTIDGVEASSGNFVLMIIDEGCGISENDLVKIREPFGQVKRDVYDASNGGLGLGLTIVGGIIERCSGSLDIASERHVGTTVSLSIPADLITLTPATSVDTSREKRIAGRMPRLLVANG